MQLKINHTTTYHYDEPVKYALQQVRLTPKNRTQQKVLNWEIEISGGTKQLEFDDQHNNKVQLISLDDGTQHVSIICSGQVETSDNAGVIGMHQGFAPLWYFLGQTPFTEPGAGVQEIAAKVKENADNDLAALHELSSLVSQKVVYQTGTTHIGTTAENALAHGFGVCQDHTHIFLSVARTLGIPARYVSGYMMLDETVEQDAGHAWAEAYVENVGWVGFDISNQISPDMRYVVVATGLDFKDAAPISGMRFGDSNESMIVNLQVQQ